MAPSLPGDQLVHVLRRALQHLYDPVELRHSPLPSLLGMNRLSDPVGDLRNLLIAAVEALKPQANSPSQTNSQRIYDLLTFRFVEQMSQKEVASDMALSLRHFQRLEAQALSVLAETIAAQHGLVLTWSKQEQIQENTPSDQVKQEIDWVKKSYPVERVLLTELFRPSAEILDPIFKAQKIHVDMDLPPDLPAAMAPVIPLQQGILHLAGQIAEILPNGSITVRGAEKLDRLVLTISARHHNRSLANMPAELSQAFALVGQVIDSAGGRLTVNWQPGIMDCELDLPIHNKQPLILAVDDNQDALQLVERYLTNSPYQFVGAENPGKVISQIEQLHPALIILDIMLPEIDGWSLLARIKQHPFGSDIPVIISTILPQEKLATMLGADGFLKKPFTKNQLLDLLAKLL